MSKSDGGNITLEQADRPPAVRLEGDILSALESRGRLK